MAKQLKVKVIDGSTLPRTTLEPVPPEEVPQFFRSFFGLNKNGEDHDTQPAEGPQTFVQLP